jgi:hypothetical protein
MSMEGTSQQMTAEGVKLAMDITVVNQASDGGSRPTTFSLTFALPKFQPMK